MAALKTFDDQLKDLYHFFVSAERNNEEVTYDQIQERLVDRSYNTLVWYANNFWSWFLEKKKERRGRYKVFICHDLVGYPEEFFIAAHMNRRGKYFYHFGRALDASRERAEARKRAKDQAGQLQTDQPDPSVPPKEAEQEFPEELHIADNEAEDIEGDGFSDIMIHTGNTFPPEDTITTVVLSNPQAITIRERIRDMLDFSRKNREAIDQLRQAIEALTRTIAQERDQLRGEIIDELQTRLQTELKALQENLLEHIQQIPSSPAALAQPSSDTVIQIQTVQQALVREQQQLREEIVRTKETLTEEVRQSRTPPDFSPIYAGLTTLTNQIDHIEQALTDALKQLPTSPDLSPIRAELENNFERLQHLLPTGSQQVQSTPELSQVAANITMIQQQLSNLTVQVGQLAQQAPVSLNSQAGSIDDSIQKASDRAKDAIDTLKDVYLKWLDGLNQQLQTAHDETGRHFQTIRAYISPGKPDEPKRSNGNAVPE
jgi:tetratricopeptide (TPR) repeat protein